MQRPVVNALRGPMSRTRRWWQNRRSNNPVNQASTPRADLMENRTEPTPPRDPEIRADLVARVRREIAEGTYETPEKWEAALIRLWERLAQD